MKILQIVPFINPGSGLGKYVLTLSSIITEAGNESNVLTTHTSNIDFEIQELKKHCAKSIGQLGAYGRFKKLWKCKRLIEAHKPDILIINYNGTAQLILPFLTYRPKTIHILHNDTPDFYRVGAINAKYVDGWIAPTKAVAERFNEYTSGKYSSKVRVIPHGVEDAFETHSKNEKLELIFVGVHYEHKGVKILPPLIKKLLGQGLDFHFTIVGKGILTNFLKEELRDEEDKGIVTFTGVISGEDVYRLQAKADIFVYPTHIDSFGLVIAEAMMNGTVPVTTLLPGITDNIVENGASGFLLPYDDVNAFVDAIQCLINNPERLAQMKKAAKEKAQKCFSLRQMSENYLTYLNTLKK